MNTETIVAVYDTSAKAQAAVHDLTEASVPADAIHQHHSKSDTMSGMSGGNVAHKEGFWESIFGTHVQDATAYDRTIASGSTVVTVKTTSQDYDRISAILERHHPIDLEEHSSEYGETTSTTSGTHHGAMGTDAGVAGTLDARRDTTLRTDERNTLGSDKAAHGALGAEGEKLQLAEEQLSVGKRKVATGGTRLRRYTVEKPVEEQVSLHQEKVTIERRPVTDGRPVADGNFADRTIEMTESREEAVVSKQARVKEEIGLRREATEHVETIKDKVRSDEVEIEQLPGGTTKQTGTGIDPVPGQRDRKV